MKEHKFCSGCKNEITGGRSVHVEDYDEDIKKSESWWHLICFKKAMNRNLTILEKQAAVMLQKANGIFNNLPDDFKQETYKV